MRYKKVITVQNAAVKIKIRLESRFKLTIEDSAKSMGTAIRFMPHSIIAKKIPNESGTPFTAQFAKTIAAPQQAYNNIVFPLIFKGIRPL